MSNAIVIIAIGAVVVCVIAWMTMGLPPSKDGFHNGEVQGGGDGVGVYTPNASTQQQGIQQQQQQPMVINGKAGSTIMMNNNNNNNRCGCGGCGGCDSCGCEDTSCGCDDCCDDCCCGGGGAPPTPFLMYAA